MENFIFKPFNEMTEADYAKIGFKSGLEIHQQLLTEKKLFCRCPAGKYTNKYDAEILRHMRPTLSELGEYDGTALMEFKTKKDIIYRIKRESVCTYEMDDTPPFLINDDALDKSLAIGMQYGCSIVDEVHIARKQYLDGSIPTGFQRTAIVALNGEIPYKGKKVSIVQLSIEEDSCREISDEGHTRIYKTDRLGMPLIESVTGPDMKTPYEVAEVCDILSRMVRSTGVVRRGMGAARQDVNVSVTGGTRIEIKGVPKIPHIPLLTYNEAMRQWNLLRLRDELHKRGITEDSFEAYHEDITRIIRKAYYDPIRKAIENKMVIKCVVLKGFKDLLHWQTQTDTYFSKEISDRVRVIACLTTIPNIIHSDSKGDTLISSEWQTIKKQVNATDNDTLVLVWGDEGDTETAVKEIIIRAKEAAIGVPSETRQALRDGTNGFERILPGADRMYPDTDLPPKKIEVERLEKLKTLLPEPFWEREEKYRVMDVPKDTIKDLAISRFAPLFDKLIRELKIDPVLASVVLIQYPKRLKKKGFNPKMLTEDMLLGIFASFKDGLLSRDGILPMMKNSIKHGKFYPELIPAPCTDSDFKDAVSESENEIKEMNFFDENNKKVLLMDRVMKKVRLQLNGSEVAKRIGLVEKEGK